jgi:hypothetical protein
MSEHGFGNAIDLSEFTLASGRTVTVEGGWRGGPEERAFLRDLNRGACEHFSTVLGPRSDRHHQDHFHLDLAPRNTHLLPRRGSQRFGPAAGTLREMLLDDAMLERPEVCLLLDQPTRAFDIARRQDD